MWDDISRISGLPPFQGCHDVAVHDKLICAKLDLEEKLRQLDLAKSDLEHVKADHRELVNVQLQLTDASSQVLALEERNDELSRDITSLEAENSHLFGDLRRLKQHLSSKEEELATSATEVNKLQQVEANQNEMIQDMREKIANFIRVDGEQKVQLDKLMSNNTKLKADKQKLEQTSSEIRTALRSQEDANESTAHELNKVKADREDLKQQLLKVEQREKDAVVLAGKSRQETEQVMTEMTEKINKTRSELEHTHKLELESISYDLKCATEENSRLLLKFEHCSHELNVTKQSNNELNMKLQISLTDLEERKEQRKQLQDQLRMCIHDKEQLQKEVRAVTEKLRSVESQLEAVEKSGQLEMESLRKQLEEAKQALELERNHHDASLKEMEDRFVSFARDLFRSRR